MPTLSASDYTKFIKMQAASQSYRNGAIPRLIQTSDQVVPTQSIMNAELLASQAAFVLTAPQTIVTTLSTTVSAATKGVVTNASATGGVVSYTTSVAHGLSVGSIVTVAGLTTFNLTNQVVIASGFGATTFSVTNATTGTAETGKTGTINSNLYYTTAAAHGIAAGTVNISISGLSTAAFNLTNATVALVPSTTVFVVSTAATGTAVTGATGAITWTRFPNTTTSITGTARVMPYNGKGPVNQPKNLSTVTRSGTLSSGKTQQVGGLPTTAAKWDGVYSAIPHLARVDTRATGGYKSVRQPV